MKTSFFSLGTYLPPPGGSGWPVPPGLYDPELGVQAMERQFAQWAYADELGYDWVSFSEHHYMPNLLQGNAITVAAAAAQIVKRAKIAVLGPIVAFNNPIRIAEEIGILDNLSGGRAVILFLRSGGFEYASYTANIEESRERTQEATELIVRAVTEPQPFGWEGKYFRYRTIAPWPTPVQKPHPPFFYSGNSFESAAFAARHRLGLACSFYSTEYLATIIDYYNREAAKAGWTPTREHVLYRGLCCICETDAEASKRGDRILNGQMSGEGGLVSQAFGRLQWQGGPETVVEQCRELHDIGFGTIDLTFVGRRPDEPPTSDEYIRHGMKLFAEEVMPKIRAFGDQPAVEGVSKSQTAGAK
jgi:alkanesulfonate monooxygenase SsuD/methylene tetrahydromethanopterin reductase-like flavin-dependent oxidoreductase (luciferase family)